MRLWAHRGCSQRYPENTLTAFDRAAVLKGLTGIELDIQMTKDGHLVVCHDERVDRTTDGVGELRGFTLAELKRLKIHAGDGKWEQIPTVWEVLDLLEDKLRGGLHLNIELKNSVFPYEGMEEKIVELVHKRGLSDHIVYSSFYAKSIVRLKELDAGAQVGILDHKVSDCLYKVKGAWGCGGLPKQDRVPEIGGGWPALHPCWRGMDLPREQLREFTVRAWFTGHLYPEKPTGVRLDLKALERQGITDVFLNEPEQYLG